LALQIDVDAQVKRIAILTKKGLFGKLVGEYRSAFRGKGMEFTGFRRYDPDNDDASRIDWKATLRSKELLVRQFEEERNLDVIFLVDTGSSMLFSSHEKLKAEYAAELVGALAYGILRAEDSVGLAVFSDRVHMYLPPQLGDEQFFRIMHVLKREEFYGGRSDFLGAVRFALSAFPKTTIIFLVSDFIGLPADFEDILKLLGVRFELIGMMIRDPRDDELPNEGIVTFLDPQTLRTLTVDTRAYAHAFNTYVREFKRDLREVFKRTQSDLVELRSNEDFIPKLLTFLSHRARRDANRS